MKIPVFSAQTEWVIPTEFPDLRQVDEIAIDLETRDPDLIKKGSGAIIGNGEVIGIAVATAHYKGYFPIAHQGGGNMDRKKVLEWFKDILNATSTKIFHNAMYDVCWIRAMGFKINGRIVDTMIAAAVTDENRFRYDLNSLSWKYLGFGKNEAALAEAAAEWGIDPKSEMYKLPSLNVGTYAERDAEATFGLWQEMKKEIISQDLESIFDLETDLFPCLVDMRFKGVRVDVEAAHNLKKTLVKEEQDILTAIEKETNVRPQIWAASSIAEVFENLKIEFERTEKTQAPSFTKNFLQEHEHPVVNMIAKAREVNKAHTTFIDSILRYEHKGRIHAEINQLRNAGGGTVTGRFSYQNPNLQQIPARNKDLGPKIRSIFQPEEGCDWGCFDYSQQEPRLVLHFAAMTPGITGLSSTLDDFNEKNSKADFHKTVADMAGIERKQAKTINLGLFYGMGKAKLQTQLGINEKQKAEELFNRYNEKVPFVKQLIKNVMDRAQKKGRVRTLLGRMCRFDMWEPKQFGMHTAMTFQQACDEIGQGNIKRAFTYKALNKLIQGSAADMTKKAMADLHDEGIIPMVQLHDELDISIESDAQAKKIKDIMENVVELSVPNKVDYETGSNWGSIDSEEDEESVDENFF